ncbi:MAG: ChbG/HpnK family deacetylase, partial [Lachnospiraceae bacterium]|nr:ChbG/HpnK family deacetylase [Lachnospiraceae bacterium]
MAMGRSDVIDIHADDYALTVRTSSEMLDLMRDGILDSISIVPNNECHEECMDMLKAAIPSLQFLPRMSVHLNLVEGYSLSSSDKRLITSTWGSLFIDSYNPIHRKQAKKLIKAEI